MNEEFNELFDIKDDGNEPSDLPVPHQNVVLHTIIRAVILIITALLTFGILFVAAFGRDINFAILAAVIVIAWFLIMIFEANHLRKHRKDQLSGVNYMLVAIAFVIILCITFYIKTLI